MSHARNGTTSTSPSPPSTPPAERPFKLPEQYAVQSVIGEGAYGVVWYVSFLMCGLSDWSVEVWRDGSGTKGMCGMEYRMTTNMRSNRLVDAVPRIILSTPDKEMWRGPAVRPQAWQGCRSERQRSSRPRLQCHQRYPASFVPTLVSYQPSLHPHLHHYPLLVRSTFCPLRYRMPRDHRLTDSGPTLLSYPTDKPYTPKNTAQNHNTVLTRQRSDAPPLGRTRRHQAHHPVRSRHVCPADPA